MRVCGAIIVLILSVSFCAAGTVSEPIADGTFRSPLLKRDIVFRVFAPEDVGQQGKFGFATVVYVKGLGIERLGTVSDSELIEGFLKKGMVVVEVDYGKDAMAKGADMYVDVVYMYRIFGANFGLDPKKKSFSPLMDEFIGWDDKKIKTYTKFTAELGGKQVEYKINPLWVYVIPAGYTIDRDIEVMTVSTPYRTAVRRIDVIHPAKPAKGVPAVLKISASRPIAGKYWSGLRKGMTLDQIEASLPPEDPATQTRVSRGACYVYTWMMAGYAGVIMDNVASFETSVGLYRKDMIVPEGPCFPEKRALRLLRGRKDELGLSGKVAVMGMSKCNIRTVMSAIINDEHPSDRYFVEADKGPYAKESGRFDAMITGGVPWPYETDQWSVILDYLSDDDPPMVWCQAVYLSRMKHRWYVEELMAKENFLREKIVKRCEAFGVPCKTFFGTPIGHDFDYIHLQDIISFVEPYMK